MAGPARSASLLAIVALAVAATFYLYFKVPTTTTAPRTAASAQEPPDRIIDTAHYSISSWATEPQTRDVGNAVEALHAAYGSVFDPAFANAATPARMQLSLYRDQKQFKQNNRSSPWAEAYYLRPTCHAYYAVGENNPYHWMLHEAVHQLNEEVAHIKRPPWIDEGLATYFGASKLRDGVLEPGTIDANAYPIWWLSSMELTGNVQADIADGRMISLRTLITSKRTDIGKNVNLFYIGYWSLSHFLFKANNGKYADGYKKVISAGGSLESFERYIGPIAVIEAAWHDDLRLKVDAASGRSSEVIVVNESEQAR